jgi:hypothetical protein
MGAFSDAAGDVPPTRFNAELAGLVKAVDKAIDARDQAIRALRLEIERLRGQSS